jgi:hypothetical protein
MPENYAMGFWRFSSGSAWMVALAAEQHPQTGTNGFFRNRSMPEIHVILTNALQNSR